jgi:hypothetical protein
MRLLPCFALLLTTSTVLAQPARTVDIPTRPGVTQRFLLIAPEKPKAAVILFAGGDGGLTLDSQATSLCDHASCSRIRV